MPPVKVHCELSRSRTGSEHKELHAWIDGQGKQEKHDLSKLKENLQQVSQNFCVVGADEFLRHLSEDVEHKIAEARREHCVDILKSAGVPEEAVQHSIRVADNALEIARSIKIKTDAALIEQGALFHDIGKAETYAIEHGKIGAEIAAKLSIPQKVIDIIEKHIRGGMTREEAQELGLPAKDYSLKTPEEKIVIYADRLVDIITDEDKIVSSKTEAEARFKEILKNYQKYGKNPKTAARYIKLHREIQGWMSANYNRAEK